MSTAKGKAVAVKGAVVENKDLAVVAGSLPALPADLGISAEDCDSFDQGDLKIPFLRILQDNSPQAKKRDPAYIEGAEPGMILHTGTNELFDGDEGIVVIAVKYTKSITEWVPRSSGGGFVADHGADVRQLDRLTAISGEGKKITPEGNELVDAGLYYAVQLTPDGGLSRAVISMTGYGKKASRSWNTSMSLLRMADGQGRVIPNPPLFLSAWRLRSVPDSNDKGSFFRWADPTFEAFTHELSAGRELLEMARKIRSDIRDGRAKVDVAEAVKPANATDLDDDGVAF